MESGLDEDAERNLLVIGSQSSYYQDAQWYLALLYVRNARNTEARAILEDFRAKWRL